MSPTTQHCGAQNTMWAAREHQRSWQRTRVLFRSILSGQMAAFKVINSALLKWNKKFPNYTPVCCFKSLFNVVIKKIHLTLGWVHFFFWSLDTVIVPPVHTACEDERYVPTAIPVCDGGQNTVPVCKIAFWSSTEANMRLKQSWVSQIKRVISKVRVQDFLFL